MVRGTPVSPGVAQGTAFVLACSDGAAAPQRRIAPGEVDGELARLEAALRRAEQELVALRASVAERIGASEAEIFAAQLLVLGDAAFRNQVTGLVREKLVNVEAAVAEVVEKFTRVFDEFPDPYLRERAADVRDVGRRVLAGLIAEHAPEVLDVPEGSVLVADELLPSVTARLELGRARAFVTERGGRFSHTAILARSLGMPAVVGVAEASLKIRTGDPVIVDGVSGAVFVHPDDGVRREYTRLEREMRAHKQALQHLVDQPAVTRDGARITLLASASKLADTEAAALYGAEGIGLYRTEFGFSVRSAFPTADEQYQVLKQAAERFHPRRVVFRLLDIGADKTLPYFPLAASRNPSLSQRGIRLLLRHPDILRPQLAAFLRVGADHPASILLPMVGDVDDVRRTRAVIAEVQADLAARGVPFAARPLVGAMIEVPSAALMARSLADEVDFLSLGTNDLVQYLLAADREDETAAPYYQPSHPAVLRLIASVVDAAGAAGRAVTICGDMAGDARYTTLLMGLGLRELSIGPGEMLDVKARIRATTLADAQALARQALTLSSASEIDALVSAAVSPA